MAGLWNTNASVREAVGKIEYLNKHTLSAKVGQPSAEINIKDADGIRHIVKDNAQAEVQYKTVKKDITHKVKGANLLTVTATGMESADQDILVQGIQSIIGKQKSNQKNKPSVAAVVIS